MGDVDATSIAMADRERGAGDGTLDAERAAGSTNERRLSGAELAGYGHHVARLQIGGKARRDLLRLLGRVRLDQKRPSCTAGSATAGGT